MVTGGISSMPWRYAARMVRRDDDGSPAGDPGGNPWSCCDDPAGESPASVSAGAPSSRPASGEILTAEAGCQKQASQGELITSKQARGPQLDVKPAASTEQQSESRAGHVAAKATSTTRAPERGVDLGGVRGAACKGSSRNTRGPSAPPLSWLDDVNRPKAKGRHRAAEVRRGRSTDDRGDEQRRGREGPRERACWQRRYARGHDRRDRFQLPLSA